MESELGNSRIRYGPVLARLPTGANSLRYIDSGNRNPNEAIGAWLQTELTPSVNELRWQSGFFSADGLAPFLATLRRLAAADLPVTVVIGSNDGDTLQSHVAQLVALIGLPRSHARLGIVSYAGAFYHPKTYHLRRDDGSQAAYVGSANLSLAGICSLHVEAGIVLDTREGDPAGVLDRIASCVDDWFVQPQRAGIEVVANAADVTRLLMAGVLSLAPTPRASGQAAGGNAGTPTRPRLQPLVRFPAFAGPRGGAQPPTAPAGAPTVILPAVPQSPHPPYVLFAPSAAAATTGAGALSGASLPSGYVGIIVRLNRDSARHWQGGTGTANISVPVATVSSLRFGIFQGGRPRPRAEYEMEMRFVYPGNELRVASEGTNVMVYGSTPGDTGHGDVRLVVPRRPARQLADLINQRGLALPSDGDIAFLEWPTLQHPEFRLTLLERSSPLFQQAAAMFTAANAAHQLLGQGACWLPPNISPAW